MGEVVETGQVVSTSPEELLLQSLQHIETADANAIDIASEIPVTDLISKVHESLHLLQRPISSANVPYRQVRDAVFYITQSSSVYQVADWVAACQLYLTLIKLVPLSYDEAAFSAVVTLMTNALKRPPSPRDQIDSGGKAQSGGRKKTGQSDSFVKSSLKFWKLLLELVSLETFAQNFADIGQNTANGFAQLLIRSSTTNDRIVSTSGLKLLTRVRSHASTDISFSFVYKSLVPVALCGLRGPAKTDFINLLLSLARSEKDEIAQTIQETEVEPEGDGHKDEESDMESSTSLHDNHNKPSSRSSSRRSSLSSMDDDTIPKSKSMSLSSETLKIIGFLHYCCASVPEKAEDRKPIFDLIVQCMTGMDKDVRLCFVKTFPRLSTHPRSTVRLFISDMATCALLDCKDDEYARQEVLKVASMVLCSRTKDKIPAVRAKALSNLGDILSKLDNEKSRVLLKELCSRKDYLQSLVRNDKVSVRKSFVRLAGALVRAILIQLRCVQMTTPNSKSDSGIRAFNPTSSMVAEWIQLVQTRSSDLMSSVRKTAIIELSLIGEHLFSSNTTQLQDMLTKVWSSGVLPRVLDDEPACQDKCLESFTQIFVVSLEEEGRQVSSNASKWEDTEQRTQYINRIVSCAGDVTSSLSEFVRTLMSRYARKEAVSVALLRALERRLLCDQDDSSVPEATTLLDPRSEILRDGTWVLFAECLTSDVSKSSKNPLNKIEIYNCALRECSLSSGKVASFFSKEISIAQQSNSTASLIEKLFDKQKWGPAFWRKSVRAIIETIAGVDMCAGTRILDRCEVELSEIGYNDYDLELEYLSFLAIIGECCTRLWISEYPPQQLLTFVRAMANTSQKSTPVRASAILTLGKVCLVEGTPVSNGTKKGTSEQLLSGKQLKPILDPAFFENFARTCLPLFVRELQDGTHTPVRNNCILVLSDLCRRFTSIVEPYATRIAARLADRSEMIRCQVLGSIGSLLQEDYLKVRSGPVFFRIALALLDDSANVHSLAKFILTKILHQQSHTLLSTSIVELVYVINGCKENKKYNQFPEQHIGLVHKPASQSRKLYPYEVFMSAMSQEQILLLSSRVCSEILTPIVDGKLSVSDSKTKGVLSDALNLLQMVEKRPAAFGASNRGSTQEDMAVTMDEGSATSKAALIRKVRIAELRCSLIPLLLELRGILEAERSPILEAVQRTLCIVLKPHQKYLQDVISDPVVHSEIEHLFSKLSRRSSTVENVPIDKNSTSHSHTRHENGCTLLQESNNNSFETMAKTDEARKVTSGSDKSSSLHEMLVTSPKLADFARQCAGE